MVKMIDITGGRFGRLHVIRRASNDAWGQATWACVCDCGAYVNVRGRALRAGTTKSCGCLRVEVTTKNRTVHGGCGTALYNAWKSMHQRCVNPNDTGWKWYGARGVRVCNRWRNFAAFKTDMGPRPSRRHSIDRVNCYGNYTPSNCRWATPKQQRANRRKAP